MNLFLAFAALVAGFVLLVKGADFLLTEQSELRQDLVFLSWL